MNTCAGCLPKVTGAASAACLGRSPKVAARNCGRKISDSVYPSDKNLDHIAGCTKQFRLFPLSIKSVYNAQQDVMSAAGGSARIRITGCQHLTLSHRSIATSRKRRHVTLLCSVALITWIVAIC